VTRNQGGMFRRTWGGERPKKALHGRTSLGRKGTSTNWGEKATPEGEEGKKRNHLTWRRKDCWETTL